MNVYKAINKVQAELAREGIGKDRKNDQQGYKFRGIDDVYNALSPMLARNGLCILPRCTERTVVERTNAKGTVLFYVTVRAEFDFVCADDGSKHTVTTYGEAMDSGDKATNKAMSAAYKYACMQAFSIPTEGDNDADATTHEVQPVALAAQNGTEANRQALSAIQPEEQDHLRKAVPAIVEAAKANAVQAKFLCESAVQELTNDQNDPNILKMALWSLLDSKTRAAIMKAAA